MAKDDRLVIGLSYLYRHWLAYRYLEDAFQHLCEVRYLGTPHKDRPGFSPDDNILDLIDADGRDLTGLVFTEDCLFAGITDLDCPTAIWIDNYWPGFYQSLRYARLVDHVFLAQRDWMSDFVSAGCRQIYWLPYACDPQVHRDHHVERTYDVGFVGHIVQKLQQGRYQLLTELSQRYRMNDFNKLLYLDEMAKVYSQSKIVVNIPHRGGFNMRVFEAMSCGALLLTEDTGNGQKELFKPGVHLEVYRSQQELFEKIDYYLAHEEKRKEIAAAGQREVLTKHRYVDRAQTILDVLQQSQNAPRYRTTDKNEILRIYALIHSQRHRPDLLLKLFRRSRCSFSTRAYIGARLLKSTINVLRAP